MAFPSLPRLPAFDATSFARRLTDGVRKPDGGAYVVFDQLPSFVQGLRAQRDALAETRVFLSDVKKDLDRHKGDDKARDAALAARVAALEARPSGPFMSASG